MLYFCMYKWKLLYLELNPVHNGILAIESSLLKTIILDKH